MINLIIFGVIGIIICSILLTFSFSGDGKFKKRKIQSVNLLKKNVIRNKLDKIVEEKIKISKRIKIEKLCIAAGYNMTYADYIITCVISAVVLSAFFKIVLNNTYLSIVFLIIGWFFPYQYFLMKANKRKEKMNTQVGSFLQMIIKKYNTSGNMKNALETSNIDFKGEYPLCDEIQRLVNQINLGKTIEDSLKEFAERTQNQYLIRFADYYKIVSEIGTKDAIALLNEALFQYKEDKKNKLLLKKEISSIKSEAYIVIAGIPLVAVYQVFSNKEFVPFMTKTVVGQVGTTVIVVVTLIAFWFVNKKIGSPIE